MTRALLIAAACALLLSACGQKETTETAPTGPTADELTAQQAQGTATPTAEGEAAPGAGMRGDGPRMPRGPMTRAQMEARTLEGFDRLDVDKDGVVTTAELTAAADERGGRGGRRLARADANNDGRITRAEATASVAAMFARLDKNNDGTIGEDERPQWGGQGGPRPE